MSNKNTLFQCPNWKLLYRKSSHIFFISMVTGTIVKSRELYFTPTDDENGKLANKNILKLNFSNCIMPRCCIYIQVCFMVYVIDVWLYATLTDYVGSCARLSSFSFQMSLAYNNIRCVIVQLQWKGDDVYFKKIKLNYTPICLRNEQNFMPKRSSSTSRWTTKAIRENGKYYVCVWLSLSYK